ncbi:hypothetical protein LTR16_001088 [Cryomyces antarcticus]|uniref:Aminoglycoside phosphotransferase domain-containing protein n=1 Tax=Cryomyces antarcticus TaxID=329879 RepID=A0ABR0LZK6_9PEZI|nr:hypothetical protein LTR16_001088 [Cryomyces antarcticus]
MSSTRNAPSSKWLVPGYPQGMQPAASIGGCSQTYHHLAQDLEDPLAAYKWFCPGAPQGLASSNANTPSPSSAASLTKRNHRPPSLSLACFGAQTDGKSEDDWGVVSGLGPLPADTEPFPPYLEPQFPTPSEADPDEIRGFKVSFVYTPSLSDLSSTDFSTSPEEASYLDLYTTKLAEFLDDLPYNPADPLGGILTFPTECELDAIFSAESVDRNIAPRPTAINVNGLASVAASVLGKLRCNFAKVLGTGMHSKVFVLTFSDGTGILARVRYDNSDVDTEAMQSEIATIAFLRKYQPKIPVPEIVYWDATYNNPAGQPFTLLTRLPGTRVSALPCVHPLLHQHRRPYRQGAMSTQLQTVLKNIAAVHAELARPLPSIAEWKLGQLRVEGVHMQKGYTTNRPEDGRTQFVVGPLTEPSSSRAELDGSTHGPYEDVYEYYQGRIERRFRELYDESARRTDGDRQPPKADLDALTDLAAAFGPRARARALPLAPQHTVLCLAHPAPSFSDILVDSTTLAVTGVLGWESARVVPLVLAASSPLDLLRCGGDKAETEREGREGKKNGEWEERETEYYRCLIARSQAHLALTPDADDSNAVADALVGSGEDELAWCRAWYRICLASHDPRFGAEFWETAPRFWRLLGGLRGTLRGAALMAKEKGLVEEMVGDGGAGEERGADADVLEETYWNGYRDGVENAASGL